ncbi:FAD/FMN-containing dehydrogenase [Agromyces hippuratus]|uniref:FAD/FMN-containing dehydrogenase n=1 Tax=Agromyces hippuratus TaxID=286438 RepID=A0A852WYB6_9MICO|nr:FAD-binding oxidoreductase [Agromyces hippuratus]NYG21240.1 FAD/FMN-containing dehydrogenase [Agromyces hippuratus]
MNTPMPSVATTDPATLSLREALAFLDDRIAGRVLISGDPGWDDARSAWNLAVDQRPTAIVVATTADDVVHTVRAAAELGLAVAPQATGHNAGPLAADDGLAGAILLRTHEMRGVEIDAESRIARVEAGAQWGDVVAAVAPLGLTALAGTAHDVGVVGYTLGGGVSWLARSHGLAANHVVAIEVVTADGAARRVDAEHEPELFWALRGGGGDLGVVTALEFGLFDVPALSAGMLLWPIERTAEVFTAWSEWIDGIPTSVTSVARVLRLPPMPELPPFLSGRSLVVIEVAMQEDPAKVDELLAPLRALVPEVDTVHPQASAELLQLHMDPPQPVPGFGDGMLLAELTPAAIRAFVDAVGPDASSALLSAEVRHLGGMMDPGVARAAASVQGTPQPGVTAGFDAGFLLFGVGIAMPDNGEALAASLGRLLSAVEPWSAGSDYLNFAEHARPAERFFGDDLERLRAVKQAVDPTGVMRSNHPIG